MYQRVDRYACLSRPRRDLAGARLLDQLHAAGSSGNVQARWVPAAPASCASNASRLVKCLAHDRQWYWQAFMSR
jgi:hypothetical protein